MKRKILSILVILMSVLYLTIPIKVFAETVTIENYVAFGDSIATGYALEDSNDGYVSLVADELGADTGNYAVSGMNSSEFLSLLEDNTHQLEIQNANLITISIGSNDLLGKIQEIACKAFGLNKDEVKDIIEELKNAFASASATEKLTMIKNFYTSLTTKETIDMFQQAIADYEQNWIDSVQILRTQNPNAKIIVTEFYNPFYGIEIPLVGSGETETINFSDYVETYISQMNAILNGNATDNYEVAKIHDKFDVKGLTNVNISLKDFNIDPHPNVEGHKVIADTIIDLLQVQAEGEDINECNFSEIDDQIYTGDEIKPELMVTDEEGNVLVEHEDYELFYSNNVEIGQATIIVSGIGKYAGSHTIYFNIVEERGTGNNNGGNNNSNNTNNGINNNAGNNRVNDTTVAQNKLPFTGDVLKTIILIGILGTIGFAIVVKIKEKYYSI